MTNNTKAEVLIRLIREQETMLGHMKKRLELLEVAIPKLEADVGGNKEKLKGLQLEEVKKDK